MSWSRCNCPRPSLGRTSAVVDKVGEIAKKIPGVQRIISITGIRCSTTARTSLTPGRLGDAEAVRRAAEDQGRGFSSIYTVFRRPRRAAGRAGFVLPPPAIQGIGNAGGFQMQLELLGGSTDYQSSRIDRRRSSNRRLRSRGSACRRLSARRARGGADRRPRTRPGVARQRRRRFRALTDYVGSTYVNQFNKFGLSLQVYVQADSHFRLHPEDLLNLEVRSQDGKMVPLGASPSRQRRLAAADHILQSLSLRDDRRRIGEGYSTGQSMAAMERIASEVLPKDVTFEWTAMSYQEKITGNQLYYVFALSLLLVYLCSRGSMKAGSCRLRCCRPYRWRWSARCSRSPGSASPTISIRRSV